MRRVTNRIFNGNTLIPISLVITVIVGSLVVGASFNQIEANAEDIENLQKRTSSLEEARIRGLNLQENLSTLQARQARTQENIEEILEGQEQRLNRLEILIDRLSRPGGTMDGR